MRVPSALVQKRMSCRKATLSRSGAGREPGSRASRRYNAASRGRGPCGDVPHLPMNVLFEDDGQLKAGTVLADHDASLQVEAASGKRLKIKSANVLLRFASPAAGEVMVDAQRLAAELDAGFLWEVSGDAEFGFDE